MSKSDFRMAVFARCLGFGAIVCALSILDSRGAETLRYDLGFVNQLLDLAEPGDTEVASGDTLHRVADLEALREQLLAGGSSRRTANGSVQISVTLWPAGRVPYQFDANVSSIQRQRFLAAAAEWEAVANVDFVPATPTDANFVHVQDSDWNSSFIGMVGGSQAINISQWNSRFLIAHELAHALGVSHEHSRSDRDTYVRINTQSIESGKEHNFTIRNSTSLMPYDFESIMHYGRYSFSSNGLPTIEARPAHEGAARRMGNLSYLSRYDISNMAELYADSSPLGLVSTTTVDEPAAGNPDGTIQPGESVQIVLAVQNKVS